MSEQVDDEILAAFEKLAEDRGELAAKFVTCVRRQGGVAAFQRVFLGRIESVLSSGPPPSSQPPSSRPSEPPPDVGRAVPPGCVPTVDTDPPAGGGRSCAAHFGRRPPGLEPDYSGWAA
jgi:hypothetical protein